MYGSEEEQNSQEYDHMHSEVKSLETWRSLLIISGKNELWHLRDLDSQEFQISSSSSQPVIMLPHNYYRAVQFSLSNLGLSTS